MKVLFIGGGGREHALAWKAAQSSRVERIYVAPGNAGTARELKVQNVAIAVEALPELLTYAQEEAVDLTIVGPEAPLVAGIVDIFRANGLRCFGPTRAAAQLEGSKSFAKDFLVRHGIPTARHQTFTAIAPAVAFIKQMGTPIVIKADGLAAGKGVMVASNERAAIAAVEDMLSTGSLGPAGHKVVIEEYLHGEEISFIAMVDGKHILPMATSQDHKTRDDGDRGPNTGGMGAYSPASVVTPTIYARIMNEVMVPTVRGMAAEGRPYTGFLYAGLMITTDGTPKVLEFNCRFGDPETQPIMMRLKSDLISLCEAALDGELDKAQVNWDPRPALGVVMAAAGYPGSYLKGDVIKGLPTQEAPDTKIFHAGTAECDGEIVTVGGRVLCVCALGHTVFEAQARAYALVRHIHWPGMIYRRDIGYRAIARENPMS